MTALIYKAALPTYTSAEALNANAGESLLLNEAGTAYELEPAQGGASGAGMEATPFTTEVVEDPLYGGDMSVLVFPVDQPVLAFKIEGDEFPRLVLYSDGSDGFYIGDGTSDPTNNGMSLWWGPDTVKVSRADLKITTPGRGLLLISPDATVHRLKVADNGTLSTEVVT